MICENDFQLKFSPGRGCLVVCDTEKPKYSPYLNMSTGMIPQSHHHQHFHDDIKMTHSAISFFITVDFPENIRHDDDAADSCDDDDGDAGDDYDADDAAADDQYDGDDDADDNADDADDNADDADDDDADDERKNLGGILDFTAGCGW